MHHIFAIQILISIEMYKECLHNFLKYKYVNKQDKLIICLQWQELPCLRSSDQELHFCSGQDCSIICTLKVFIALKATNQKKSYLLF